MSHCVPRVLGIKFVVCCNTVVAWFSFRPRFFFIFTNSHFEHETSFYILLFIFTNSHMEGETSFYNFLFIFINSRFEHETLFYSFPFTLKCAQLNLIVAFKSKLSFCFYSLPLLTSRSTKLKSLLFTVGTILLAAFVTAFRKIKMPDASYSVIPPVKTKTVSLMSLVFDESWRLQVETKSHCHSSTSCQKLTKQ